VSLDENRRYLTPFDYAELGFPCTGSLTQGDAVPDHLTQQKACVSRALSPAVWY